MNLKRVLASSTLFMVSAAIAALPSTAGADQNLRFQVDQRGDFVMIGNTMGFDCNGGVPAPVAGSVTCPVGNNNDSSPDIFWRSQEPTPTTAVANVLADANSARSSSLLALPAGSTITNAFLYWGAQRTFGADDNDVQLDRPGGFSADVDADDCYEVVADTDNETVYECVADVTDLVIANGVGNYRVSGMEMDDFRAQDDEVSYAGWTLVVLYSNPSQPRRNLAVFDGLDEVDDDTDANATLDGFLVPVAFDAKLGVIAYEGDSTVEGDSLRFGTAPLDDGDRLANAVNPINNFFNSTRSFLGSAVSVTGDLPQLTGGPRSMGSFDFDVIDISDRVTPGQTSANIQATSTQDVFFLGAFITSISTFKPDFTTSTKSVQDVNGGDVVEGDQLRYTIVATNTGNDIAVNVVMTDDLPDQVTYVPGSIEITAGNNVGPKTDAVNDDQCEFQAGVVRCRLGAGANASTGGSIGPNNSSTITFLVTINPGTSGTVLNQAIINAGGQLGSPPEDTPTDGDGGTPGQDPTDIDVDECTMDADCVSGVCDTDADPNVCVECLEDDDCVGNNTVCDPGSNTCDCTPTGGPEVCGNQTDEDCDGVLDNGCVDTDGDGLPDDLEDSIGTDPNDADSDDDGVIDGDEPSFNTDSDGDGLINALDPDSDNDGLFDGTELGLDCTEDDTDVLVGNCIADADGGATDTNPLDPDTDDGSVSDGNEDSNHNGAIDPGETDPNDPDDDVIEDADGDGLSDDFEDTIGTDPNDADSDDDGLIDGLEPNPSTDSDGDGLINPLDPDADDDGLFDGTEAGKDCANPDTDIAAGNCVADADPGTTTEVLIGDTDGGTASDGSEDCNLNGAVERSETDPNNPGDDDDVVDQDGDGLSDCVELQIGTDPDDQDSDDDGLIDGQEPNPGDDTDGDGAINALDPDSDDDGLFDGTETGNDCNNPDTDPGNCIADADNGATTTDPLNPDTDGGSVSDGDEDQNHNGVIDRGETDPNDPSDDVIEEGGGGAGGGNGGGNEDGGNGADSAGGNGGGDGGNASGEFIAEGGGLCVCSTPGLSARNNAASLGLLLAMLGLLRKKPAKRRR